MSNECLDEIELDDVYQFMALLVLNDELIHLVAISVLDDVHIDSIFLVVVNNKVIRTILNVEKDIVR